MHATVNSSGDKTHPSDRIVAETLDMCREQNDRDRKFSAKLNRGFILARIVNLELYPGANRRLILREYS